MLGSKDLKYSKRKMRWWKAREKTRRTSFLILPTEMVGPSTVPRVCVVSPTETEVQI